MFLERSVCMKKIFIQYYAIVMLVLFIVFNILLGSLRIGGLIYQLFMFVTLGINVLVLIRFKNEIQYKGLVPIVYFLLLLFSKDSLQFIFAISSMVTLIVIGFMQSNFIKIIALVFVSLFVILSYLPLSFFLLTFMILDNGKERNDIYEDTHYYCENHFEAYSYSAGATDSFHYSIGKHYEIIDLDDILYITYNKRNETSQQEYENYIKNYNCILVGDQNEFE